MRRVLSAEGPCRILSANRLLRLHFMERSRVLRSQRHTGYLLTVAALGRTRARPHTVTITRIGPRAMDDDNAAGGCKGLRDGIAFALRIDDGDSRVRWQYKSSKRKDYAVKIDLHFGEESQ